MKKLSLHSIITFILILTALSGFLSAGNLKLLRIEDTGEREKLVFNITDIEAITAGFDTTGLSVFIEFADMNDKVLAHLGKLKDGKIKWIHSMDSKEKMLVKFDKIDFPGVVQSIREKPMKPGFQVILSNQETNEVLKSFEICIQPYPDLTIEAKYPIKIQPGEELKEKITVTVKNEGAASCGNFYVDFALINEDQSMTKIGSMQSTLAKDVIIKNGVEESRKLNPGESFDFTVEESLKVPNNFVPGRCQFEAKVDSRSEILELDEENNTFRGFIIVSLGEPKRLLLELPETRLVFEPENWNFKILFGDNVLSDGKDWRKCRIKANMYQLRHASWPDFHWEIDTFDRSVWKVTGAPFCKPGGKAKELKIKVLVQGGSKTEMPARVELSLANTSLYYKPETREFNVTSFDDQIAYIPFWQTCQLEAHLYQFKHVDWKELYWEADTFKNEVKQVSGGQFCKRGTGANITPLKINLKVEN